MLKKNFIRKLISALQEWNIYPNSKILSINETSPDPKSPAQTQNLPPRHARGLSNQVNNGYTKPLTFPRIQNHALIWSFSNSSVVVNYLLLNTISFLLTQMIHMPANQRTCQRFTTSLLPKTRPWNCWKWILQSECNAPATPTLPKTFCQICENTEHSKKRCAALSGTSWHAAHKIPSPSCSPLFCKIFFCWQIVQCSPST